MVKAVLLVAVALALRPATANACDNAVEWTTDDYVRVVIKAEKFLEQGQYGRAKKTLGRMKLERRFRRSVTCSDECASAASE